MVNDTVADLLTRIRNANSLKAESVSLPSTVLNTKIAKVLKDNGFILDYANAGDGAKKVLTLKLKYDSHGNRIISGLKRISKPGLRVYAEADELPKVLNGLGIAIVSTSKGILTDAQCRKEHVGGEVLAFVW